MFSMTEVINMTRDCTALLPSVCKESITTDEQKFILYVHAKIAHFEYHQTKNQHPDYYCAWCAAKSLRSYFPPVDFDYDSFNQFVESVALLGADDPFNISRLFPQLFPDPNSVFQIFKPTDDPRKQLYNLIELSLVLLLHSEINSINLDFDIECSLESFAKGLLDAYHNWSAYKERHYDRLFNFESNLLPLWLAIYGTPFDTSEAKKTTGISGILPEFINHGIDNSSILKCFFVVKTFYRVEGFTPIIDPLAYLRQIFLTHAPVDKTASPGEDLFLTEHLFASCVKRWRDIDTIDFVRSLFFKRDSERITSEICFTFPLIQQAIIKSHSILLVDPNPNLLLKTTQTETAHDSIIFAFSNLTLAQLYKQRFPDFRIAYLAPKDHQQNSSSLLYEQKIDHNHSGRELRFESIEITELFDSIFLFSFDNAPLTNTLFILCQKAIVDLHWVCPNSIHDSLSTAEKRSLYADYTDISLQTFPAIKSSDGPKKVTLFHLSKHSPDKSSSVKINRSFVASLPERMPILCKEPWAVCVPREKFLLENRTIKQFWRKYRNQTEDHLPNVPSRITREFRFSQEISLWYSLSNGRGSFYFCACPSLKQIRKNSFARGKRLSKSIPFRAKSISDAENTLNTRIFDNLLYDIISKEISKAYRNQPMSLKSFWYCNLTELRKNPSFNEELSFQLFYSSLADLTSDKTYSLETYQNIFENDFSEIDAEKKVILWKQLNIILSLASRTQHRFYPNPISEFVQSLVEKDRGYLQVRQNMAKRSYEVSEEFKILQYAYKNWTSDYSLIGATISFFTGINNRDICALNWEDYYNFLDDYYQFWITKTVNDSNEVIPIDFQDRNRYRRIPVISVLRDLLNDYRKHIERSITSNNASPNDIRSLFKNRPLVCMNDNSFFNRCTPTMIRNAKHAMEKAAGIEPFEIGITNNGSEKTTDINKYGSDRFRSNFQFRITQTCILSPAETNYILGINPPTTFAKHYCDYTNDFSQLIIANKLERWIAAGSTDNKVLFRQLPSGSTKSKLKLDTSIGRSCIQLNLNVPHSRSSDIIVSIDDTHGLDIVAYRSEGVKKK